jgi:hypothetical protein
VGSQGTIGEVQWTKEERIAKAIKGKGEYLSEELKKLLREIEVARGLRAGALEEETEARIRGVTEPSVEKLKEALRNESTGGEVSYQESRVWRGRDGGEPDPHEEWNRQEADR